MQEGYSDCGLFAIAFMTALANGKLRGVGGGEQDAMRDQCQPDSVPGQDEILQPYLVLQAIGHFGKQGNDSKILS